MSLPQIRTIITICGTMAMYALFYKGAIALGVPEIVVIPVGMVIFGSLCAISISQTKDSG